MLKALQRLFTLASDRDDRSTIVDSIECAP
jgi:hypothetical protein